MMSGLEQITPEEFIAQVKDSSLLNGDERSIAIALRLLASDPSMTAAAACAWVSTWCRVGFHPPYLGATIVCLDAYRAQRERTPSARPA